MYTIPLMEHEIITGMDEIKSVGVVGLGGFGKFVVSLLPDSVEILVNDADAKRIPEKAHEATLGKVASADVVILAVPLASYEELLPQLAKDIRPETLVIDVCSVKSMPEELIKKFLPQHANILATHPLFGPQSAKNGTKDHQLIVTSKRGEIADKVLDYCSEKLGLDIVHLSADEHDKIMGQIHVLTFFLARALGEMKLKDTPFMTPSYKMISDLVTFNASHSNELFETIQLGNPYAATMRDAVIKAFEDVNDRLSSEELFKEQE